MRNIIFIIAFFALVQKTHAQTNLTGRVTSGNKTGLADVTILLTSGDEKLLISSAISSVDGHYNIITKPRDAAKLIFSAIGFSADTILLKSVKADTIIDITLKSISKQLEDVSVISRKPLIERKLDRLVFNIENSLSSNIGDALDALGKAPGVRVNDDGLQMIGKNSLRVMVNNRPLQLSGPNLIAYLRSLPSSTLKTIEVITNPSAKYEADGNSGIININIKKDQTLGLNGMINLGTVLASYHNTGLTGILNYNTKKLHLSSTLTSYLSKSRSFSNLELITPSILWDQYDENISERKGIRGEVRADYDASKNTTLGVRYSENHNANDLTNYARGDFFNSTRAQRDSILIRSGQNKVPLTNRSFDVYLDSKLDTAGKKIEISANYFNNRLDNGTYFQNITSNGNGSLLRQYIPVGFDNDESTNIFSGRADLTLPFKFANLELGAKVAFVKSKNTLFYSQGSALDLNNSNNFAYKENTQALYLNASRSIKKWSFQIGLRMENTQTDGISSLGQKNSYDYLALFPSLFLRNSITENHTLSFSYGRRINRPDYQVLNPAKIYSAVNIYDQGNPFLRPSFSNNLELGYSYKDLLTTNFYANFLNNGFSILTFIEQMNNIQSNQYRNYSNSTQIGISETISLSPTKWWESSNQLNLYHYASRSNGALLESELNGLSAYISTDNTLMLNKKKTFMANAMFWYQFPDQSNWYISRDYYSLDLSLRAAFIKRTLTITAGIVDIFKTSQRYYDGLVNGIGQNSTRYNDNRKFRLMLMYRIGNSRANKRARALDDTESIRVRQ